MRILYAEFSIHDTIEKSYRYKYPASAEFLYDAVVGYSPAKHWPAMLRNRFGQVNESGDLQLPQELMGSAMAGWRKIAFSLIDLLASQE